MSAQLQTVATGLETVTNKVAYLEHQDVSDYSESDEDEEEACELAAEANAFFIGEGGAQAPKRARRGCRRKRAGNDESIVKKSRS